jgi:hypothetical protein
VGEEGGAGAARPREGNDKHVLGFLNSNDREERGKTKTKKLNREMRFSKETWGLKE